MVGAPTCTNPHQLHQPNIIVIWGSEKNRVGQLVQWVQSVENSWVGAMENSWGRVDLRYSGFHSDRCGGVVAPGERIIIAVAHAHGPPKVPPRRPPHGPPHGRSSLSQGLRGLAWVGSGWFGVGLSTNVCKFPYVSMVGTVGAVGSYISSIVETILPKSFVDFGIGQTNCANCANLVDATPTIKNYEG
jgi:hypothetical protein